MAFRTSIQSVSSIQRSIKNERHLVRHLLPRRYSAIPLATRSVRYHASNGRHDQRRCYASEAAQGRGAGSWAITGAAGLGVLLTIYGLFEYFYKSQVWPEPVRSHLKNALKARNRGDYEAAEGYFQQAISASLALPPSSLAPSPLLKLSGLYITYAAMLESNHQPLQAYTVLMEAYALFGPNALKQNGRKDMTVLSANAWINRDRNGDDRYKLSGEDHVRAIGLVQKLGHLAVQFSSSRSPPPVPLLNTPSYAGRAPTAGVHLSSSRDPAPSPLAQTTTTWTDIAEQHLSSALAAMLRLGLTKFNPDPTSTSISSPTSTTTQQVILGTDLDLPSSPESTSTTDASELSIGRVDRRGVAMTMEALAEIYAKQGQYDLASQLLLQTVSLLLPVGSPGPPPIPDQCQAALLMTTLSSHLARPQTAESTRIARSWSLSALQRADGALRTAGQGQVEGGNLNDTDGQGIKVCMQAKSVGSFNLGMLAELEKDPDTAASYFAAAGETARRIGFKQGQQEAIEGIRRVRSGSK